MHASPTGFFPAPARPFPAPPVERGYTAGGCSYIIYRCTAVEPAGGCSFCCSSALRHPASRRGRPETGLRPVATGLRPVVPGLSPVTTRPIPGFCAAGAFRGRLGNMLMRPMSVSGRKRIFAEAIYVRPSAPQGASVQTSVPARIFMPARAERTGRASFTPSDRRRDRGTPWQRRGGLHVDQHTIKPM